MLRLLLFAPACLKWKPSASRAKASDGISTCSGVGLCFVHMNRPSDAVGATFSRDLRSRPVLSSRDAVPCDCFPQVFNPDYTITNGVYLGSFPLL